MIFLRVGCPSLLACDFEEHSTTRFSANSHPDRVPVRDCVCEYVGKEKRLSSLRFLFSSHQLLLMLFQFPHPSSIIIVPLLLFLSTCNQVDGCGLEPTTFSAWKWLLQPLSCEGRDDEFQNRVGSGM